MVPTSRKLNYVAPPDCSLDQDGAIHSGLVTGLFLYAFDLIELDGDNLRRDPLAARKATLASLLRRAAPGLRFNEHLDNEDGPLVFAHACKLGLEGIVSKRKDFALSVRTIAGLDQEQEPGAVPLSRGLRLGFCLPQFSSSSSKLCCCCGLAMLIADITSRS